MRDNTTEVDSPTPTAQTSSNTTASNFNNTVNDAPVDDKLHNAFVFSSGHYVTFDGVLYDYVRRGDFILYKSNAIEVQVSFKLIY